MTNRSFKFTNGTLDGETVDVPLDPYGQPFTHYTAGDEEYELRGSTYVLVP